MASTTSSTSSGPIEPGDRPQPPDAGLDFGRRGVLPAAQPADDAGPGPSGADGVGFDQDDLAARLQQHLGDPRPHGAAADHCRPAHLVVRHGSILRPGSGRLGGRPPEHGQQGGRPAAAGEKAEQEPAHRRVLEDAGGVVERPLPRPEPGEAEPRAR